MSADISVVIGAQNARSTIGACLDSLLSQTKSLNAEILVADASNDGTREIVRANYPKVVLIDSEQPSLVPHLWGVGMQRAAAPIIALTTAHCIPKDDWISKIIDNSAAHANFAGIGGPIAPPEDAPAKDWAVYFSRYSAFMPPAKSGPVADIPGDNAVYRKDALDSCWKDRDKGFWETIFHHEVRNQGGQLMMSPDILVALGHTDSALDYFRVRFRHGIHYGSTRPNNRGFIRIIRILAAPILMPYLVLRIGRRVIDHRPDWLARYMFAVPWLTFFMLGWSLGEIVGYLTPEITH